MGIEYVGYVARSGGIIEPTIDLTTRVDGGEETTRGTGQTLIEAVGAAIRGIDVLSEHNLLPCKVTVTYRSDLDGGATANALVRAFYGRNPACRDKRAQGEGRDIDPLKAVILANLDMANKVLSNCQEPQQRPT